MTSGQVAAAFLVEPLVYAAEEQGLNVLGYYKDYIPNYQLTVMSVKRAWAAKNRPLLVRFLKGALRANHWLFANKEPASEFLAKEIQIAPDLARKGMGILHGQPHLASGPGSECRRNEGGARLPGGRIEDRAT